MAEAKLPGIVGLRTGSSTRACDVVADQLRGLVLDGTLGSGDRLPSERDLAVRFETSRATISQALRVLHTIGLVDIQHGNGVFVRHHPERLLRNTIDLMLGLDKTSMVRLVEIRGWLETNAAVRAAEIATEADVARLTSTLALLAGERLDPGLWLEHDRAFHQTVIRATGNSFAESIVGGVIELMNSSRLYNWSESRRLPDWFAGGELEGVIAIHEQIADGIGRHDLEATREAALQHQAGLEVHVAERDPWFESGS